MAGYSVGHRPASAYPSLLAFTRRLRYSTPSSFAGEPFTKLGRPASMRVIIETRTKRNMLSQAPALCICGPPADEIAGQGGRTHRRVTAETLMRSARISPKGAHPWQREEFRFQRLACIRCLRPRRKGKRGTPEALRPEQEARNPSNHAWLPNRAVFLRHPQKTT